MNPSSRKLALDALREWRQSRSFADAIQQRLWNESALTVSDRAFATELFYGVLRNLTLLDFWIGRLRESSLDDDARDILRLGLYQLFFLRTAGHAAIFETVALATARKRSLINAVLRSAQRRFEELEKAAADAPRSIRQSHPEFLLERWTRAFGAEASAALCEWNNLPAPIYARVNALKTEAGKFHAEHPSSEEVAGLPGFFRLPNIPHEGLARGDCYIQDPSTRLACELLDPQPGEIVLDACAAPGGKTALLAQLMDNRGEIVACDRDPVRVEILRANLARLGVTIAPAVEHDWRAGPLETAHFDRILVDAPCTNTGVMRRRVDVRWRLQPEDFARMQLEQLRILRAVIPLLRPNGVLVYSTCSLEAEENEQVIARLLEEFTSLRCEEKAVSLPFTDGFDGAFAAKLRRTPV